MKRTPNTQWLAAEVTRALRRIEKDPAYHKWSGGSLQQGDAVVFNNSFLFRRAQGSAKSLQYLMATCGKLGRLGTAIRVVQPRKGQNVDFRRISANEPPPNGDDLKTALEAQRRQLGSIVFALIASTVDDRTVSCEFQHGPFEEIALAPNASAEVEIRGTATVAVKHVGDESALWGAFSTECARLQISPNDAMKAEFAKSLDTLAARAAVSLVLPEKTAEVAPGITDDIVAALQEQKKAYSRALAAHRRAKLENSRRRHFNEVLRIAYSFAHEAAALLDLVVSIVDLKPLVLWCTIDRHFALSEAMRALPWTRSKNKPSMKNYIDTIGDARNRAFHNVFPFDKALHFALPDGAFRGAELRLFSEFGNKAHGNDLTYSDKALVEVLTRFTRARTRPTPYAFWTKNEGVMEKMIALFSATNDVLKRLYYQ